MPAQQSVRLKDVMGLFPGLDKVGKNHQVKTITYRAKTPTDRKQG
jgi:hypothetical protein